MIHPSPDPHRSSLAVHPTLDVRPRVASPRHHLIGTDRVLRTLLGLVLTDDPAATAPGRLDQVERVTLELHHADGRREPLGSAWVDELGLFDVAVDERLSGLLVLRALDAEDRVLGANAVQLGQHPFDDVVIDAETSVATLIWLELTEQPEQLWEHDGWLHTQVIRPSRAPSRLAA